MAGKSKGCTSIQRVRKYRARKASTAEGQREIRNKNCLYKARSRRKLKIKSLSGEKSKLVANLSPARQIYIDNKSLLFRAGLLRTKGGELGKDEQQEVDIEVLTHEINLAKMLRAKDVAERALGGAAYVPHLPFVEDDLIEDDELMDALSTSFGTAAESAYTPLKDLFETADGDVDVASDELFHHEVSAMFDGARDGGPLSVPSSMEPLVEGLPPSMEALPEDVPSSMEALPEDVPSSMEALPGDVPSSMKVLPEDVPSSMDASADDVPSSMEALAEDVAPSSMGALAQDVPSSMESLLDSHGTWGSEVSDEDLLCALSNSLDQYLR